MVTGNLVTCYTMGKLWGHCGNLNKLITKKPHAVWFHLYEISRIVKLIETKSRIMAARGFREEAMGVI